MYCRPGSETRLRLLGFEFSRFELEPGTLNSENRNCGLFATERLVSGSIFFE